MLKNSLLEIIRTFSKEELAKFEDFARSPYHNKNSNAMKLWNHIRKFAPDFESEKLRKEEAWKVLFPVKGYNYGVMKNLIHDLTKLAEQFIKFEHYAQIDIRNEFDLCYAVFKRNLFKLLTAKYAAFEKKYNESNYSASKLTAWEYYNTLSDYQALKSYTTIAYKNSPEAEDELILSSDYDLYYLLLRSLYAMPNYQVGRQFNKRKYSKTNLLEELLDFISPVYIESLLEKTKERSKTAYVLISCYHLMYKAMSINSSESDYFNFKQAVISAAGTASTEDFKVLVRCLTISLGNVPRNKLDMHREMFEINNLMLANNIFLEENGFLKEISFNKYVSYCCTCKSPDVAEKFVSEYSRYLPEASKTDCMDYTSAEISFAKGKYVNSLKLLNRVNSIYFDLKYTTKCLEIMNHFELNDFDSFLYLLDASKHLAKYNKPLELELTPNFTKFYDTVSALFLFRKNNDDVNLRSLRKDIQNSYPIRKTWLLEKIDELLKLQ